MTDAPDMSMQKLSVSAVLAYRRQLVEGCQAKQNQLTETITESDREEIIAQPCPACSPSFRG